MPGANSPGRSGRTIDSLSRAGYPILNGSCLHLGSERPGWFHTQREQSCPGKKLGHKYAYYGVNTSKYRASAGFACCRPCGLARTEVSVPYDPSHTTGGTAPATE